MKTLHTIVEETELQFAKQIRLDGGDYERELSKSFVFLDTFATSLLSAFEELVPRESIAIPTKSLSRFGSGYNACRTELMARIAAFKEGRV